MAGRVFKCEMELGSKKRCDGVTKLEIDRNRNVCHNGQEIRM
jgi:hypothetical protein